MQSCTPIVVVVVVVAVVVCCCCFCHSVQASCALLTIMLISLLAFWAGKLCLRDKELAKSSVNILVRELDTAVDPAVRSNALVVLGDLCVRSGGLCVRHPGFWRQTS